VSFETLVSYVDSQFSRIVESVNNLVREVDRHQEWHRGALEEQLRQRSSNGWSWTGVIFQTLSTLIAAAALVVVIVQSR
jgi:hypothetical protein